MSMPSTNAASAVDLTRFIDHPELLDANALPALQQALREHPYNQLAQLLLVACLKQLHAPTLREELRRASILLPDRTVLYHLLNQPVENERPAAAEPAQKQAEPAAANSFSLIDSYLSAQAMKTINEADPQTPSIAQVTSDYAQFLMQQDGEQSADGDDSATTLLPPFAKSEKAQKRNKNTKKF